MHFVLLYDSLLTTIEADDLDVTLVSTWADSGNPLPLIYHQWYHRILEILEKGWFTLQNYFQAVIPARMVGGLAIAIPLQKIFFCCDSTEKSLNVSYSGCPNPEETAHMLVFLNNQANWEGLTEPRDR